MVQVESKVQISDVMTKHPVVTKPATSIEQVAQTLNKYQISSILVLESKKVVGIITSDDIVYRVIAEGKDPKKVRAKDIMTSELVMIGPSASVQEAVQLLNDEKVRQLPIVSDGKLVGYVTVKDILRIEPELVHMVRDDLRRRQDERNKFIQRYVNDDHIEDDLFE